MTARLQTLGICKHYDSVTALSPTDLTVQDGEFLTLLGPSGSGKTTLLQIIAGLVEPSAGQLIISGKEATHKPAGERGIGMVFQSYALFPHLSVWENIAYPLRMRKMDKAAITAAVQDALDMVQMGAYVHRLPRELSGGQQQRIALARCFVYKPSVILLDEPLGALDKKLREHMQAEIRKLHKELGATFIYVTHDQEEALNLSDRICLMNNSKIEQLGTPEDLYDRPATAFSAQFIGYSNLLRGTAQRGAGGVSVLHHGRHILPLDAAAAREGRAQALVVRPEQATPCGATEALLNGQVTEVVFAGSDYRVLVDVGGDEPFLLRCSRRDAPEVGANIGLRWNPAHAAVVNL
ncbi:ABC transporter ATP-binding protein [Herbaspirillum sp. AP02]|uniref:ABC transporter ATP-binding protein n=1 Tax=unclassified Herbaspirillum TaxID=2624150 RepID=UPI0015DA9D49|nr:MULTISPECIES: ABC transporter ATP-binding protein [unclassified Herbaspirillum]MBG7622124.1 ABC transporter ATP-binding protein [Herbaspirillum sp. AP02]NZD69143.1 ABC transporter ATP-binding protein [Herbaspirillum sp. AP21]